MVTYLIKGGPIMIPIVLCSVAAGAFVVIAWARLKEASKNPGRTIYEINQAIQQRNWAKVTQILNQTAHPFLQSWQAGFHLLIEGKSDLRNIEETVAIEGSKTLAQLESPLKKLGALITILPMLGFLGTIMGLIMSFETWERLGSQVSISQLAGGIYQAMITTAAGLIAAIPYHLIYHFFTARIEKLAIGFSRETTDLFRKIRDALIQEIPMEPEPVLTSKS